MKVLQNVCGVSTAAIALSISGAAQAASVSLTDTNTYNQEFNTLSSIGIPSGFLPLGWQIVETGANADGQYHASDGSSNLGDTYSFGRTGITERALGSILSGSLARSA
jgi:hypothetical protein